MLAEKILSTTKKNILITGCPGAGKTSLVEDVASVANCKKFLYLSFGSDNAKSAKHRMPGNVVSSSFHALAKSEMDIDSSRLVARFSMTHASGTLKQFAGVPASPKMVESFVLLLRFFCMSGSTLQRCHDVFFRKEAKFPHLDSQEKTFLFQSFRWFWEDLWKAGSSQPVTHDMYLKAYSLRVTTLPYDYLIVDEYQDLNDAMQSMLSRVAMYNPELTVIRLGDPCQQIYSFRGASNHITLDPPDFVLDTSLRFGKRLASLANRFMDAQQLAYYTPIRSDTDHTEISEASSINELSYRIKNGFRPTVIARNNMTLWLLLKSFALQGIPCALSGGFKHDLAFLRALYLLKTTGQSEHPGLCGVSYRRFYQQARSNHDTPMQLACRFVDSMERAGDDVFKTIQAMLVPPHRASVFLATLHQAKGLEFNHVVLADDFIPCWDSDTATFFSIDREEAHIIYTAITRAKKSLALPKGWSGLLSK